MRAMIYTVTGDPSVLRLVERRPIDPGPREVRVRVAVSGVNPTDWKVRSGASSGGAMTFAEVVPHQDGAGTIDAIGPGVTEVAVGDRVWMLLAQHERPTGTAQEMTTLPVERVFPLPNDVSFDAGASLGVPAVTAHRALTIAEHGPDRLTPGALIGATVLVAGGAGAVGHAAIQLARWAGATVVTTVSSHDKVDLATAAGADHVVNYRSVDAIQAIRSIAPNGVDIVVEVAAGQNSALDLEVAASGAAVAIYANNGAAEFAPNVRAAMTKNLRYQFVLLYSLGSDALTAATSAIADALRDGALPVGRDAGLPLHRFPLERTADAHQAVEGGAIGKVLIDVAL